jgi:hypothetical protein
MMVPAASTRQDFAEDETSRESDQQAGEGLLLDAGGDRIRRLFSGIRNRFASRMAISFICLMRTAISCFNAAKSSATRSASGPVCARKSLINIPLVHNGEQRRTGFRCAWTIAVIWGVKTKRQ